MNVLGQPVFDKNVQAQPKFIQECLSPTYILQKNISAQLLLHVKVLTPTHFRIYMT